MSAPTVIVLGGGLSGIAAAYALARAGWKDITVIERGSVLGGLAGSFERDGHFYPLGYHHILHRDHTLLSFLDLIGTLPNVHWRAIRMLFYTGRGLYDLSSPLGFLRFPMSLADKVRFARLMLKAFRKRDWSDWEGRSAAELVDSWGSAGVRRTIFDPLCRLKFELPCESVSGAWLGARLHFREGAAPLGYIPGANWTKILCDGLAMVLQQLNVRVRLQSTITAAHVRDGRITEVVLADGETIEGDVFVSTVPTEVYLRLASDDTPHLASIRYTALISVVCATAQQIAPDFYWMNLASLDRTACGLFMLNSLNPTIGAPGENCLNFVTHLQSRHRALFTVPDDQLIAAYLEDFARVFGRPLVPLWTKIVRVPMYSPIFHHQFRNPPVRSCTWNNVYFAGNYRTFPSVASTGTALESGLEAAEAILRDYSQAPM